MWIEVDGPHRAILNAAKLDRIYVVYKGPSNYAVIGAIGDRDILIKSNIPNAKDASDWVDVIKAKLAN